MTLADSPISLGSRCYKGHPVVTHEWALFNGVQWMWFPFRDTEEGTGND